MKCIACFENIEIDDPNAIILYCYRNNTSVSGIENWGSPNTRVIYGLKGERIWDDERRITTGVDAPGSHIIQLNR